MRFYPGAHDYLLKASRKADYFDQHLYLVAEFDNEYDKNAVMLHNGKQKLGSVNATQSPAIKRLLAEWIDGPRGDFVVVCKMDRIQTYDEVNFPYVGSITVYGKHRVNERLARKYADKFRKD